MSLFKGVFKSVCSHGDKSSDEHRCSRGCLCTVGGGRNAAVWGFVLWG